MRTPMTLSKTVALVGMMGAGKTSLGRKLAAKLEVAFRDADQEIETAAGLSVSEIFEKYGEPYFRDGERRVIARLLGEEPHVLATGGGAFMDAATRAAMKEHALTVWLKTPIHVLLARVKKKDTRPLLKGRDPKQTIEALLAVREPIYAEADITLECPDESHHSALERMLAELRERGLET